MNIIDRARDALKSPHSFVYGGEYAAAVDRAAKLADKLHAQGQRLSNSTYAHERAEGAGYTAAAAQLVAALEGEKE